MKKHTSTSEKNKRGQAPVKPEKDIPAKPDKNPDPTKRKPGVNEPEKIDPTRIEEPEKSDPTRINPSPTKPETP
ncbi:MAG: hypothetical protein HYU69_08635 [Bacteroidetes bacterium]|nr:hypothetical protein [Bacteroidota bacterium]